MDNNSNDFKEISLSSIYPDLHSQWITCPKCKTNLPQFSLCLSFDSPQINFKCICTDKIISLPLKDYLAFLQSNSLAIKSYQCSHHSTRNAVGYCYQCQEYFCLSCHNYHKERYKEHLVSFYLLNLQSKCMKHHDSQENIYCETCSAAICDICRSDMTHKTHQTNSFTYIWKNITSKDLIGQFEKNKKQLDNQRQMKNALIKQLDSLIGKYTKMRNDLVIAYERTNTTNAMLMKLIEIILNNHQDTELFPNFNLMKNITSNIIFNDNSSTLIKLNDNNDINKLEKIDSNINELTSYLKENVILHNNIKCIQSLTFHSTSVNSLIELNDNRLASISHEIILCNNHQSKSNDYSTLNLLRLKENYASIECIVQLSNGRIATGSSDKTIKIYDQFNLNLVGEIKGHIAWINSLYQLKDNRLISGSYQMIKVWDINSYTCLGTLELIGGSVISLCQLKTMNLLSASEDGSIRQWEMLHMQLVMVIPAHEGWVNAMIILHDDTMATGGNDTMIRLWDTNNFKSIGTLIGHKHYVKCLCQLNDKRLLSGSFKMIKVWNVISEQCIATIEAHEDYITMIINLRNGNVGTASKDALIKLWSI